MAKLSKKVVTQANAAPSPALQGAGQKKTPSTKPSNKKKKDKGKGTHYSTEEIDLIMDIVGRVLPSGGYMWERVTKEYNDRKPRGSASREMESVRSKFRKFCNEKKPTGDPNCPEHVKRAKRIQHEIDNACGVQEMHDDDDSDDESEDDESEDISIISGSKNSSDEGNHEAAQLLDSPVLIRQVLRDYGADDEAAVGDMQPRDNNGIIPETIVLSQDLHDAQPVAVLSSSSSPEKNPVALSRVKKSQPDRQTRAPSTTVKIPSRLGVGEEQLSAFLSDALSKKETSSKRDRSKGIPEHPAHSKKASLAREIKDVNDEFKRDKEDHMLRFQAAKREQDLRHLQEMERIKSEREVSDRRYNAEMDARREERALAERRFDAEAARQNQAMNMQMGFFAALLGGRGISMRDFVQPSSLSSGAATNHPPNT
jgi:hypothetical protein